MPEDCIFDVGITGAGPAGLALAAALCARGARVAIVDPTFGSPWRPNWCSYEDELPEAPVKQRWNRVRVDLDDGSKHFDRAYVQVDGLHLQEQLIARSEAATVFRAPATRVIEGGMWLADGTRVRCSKTVDCSGAAQVLGTGERATAFQTAWGLEIETEGHPWEVDTALFMDLRGLDTPPSFLYALPRDERRVFVEETSLAASPAVPLPLLEKRLHARLDAIGVVVRAIHHVERCNIPLDVPVHPGLAFGAAAGMIHPGSGYVLARVLTYAPELAKALDGGNPHAVLRRARGGFARRLHLLGLDVLTAATGEELSNFFTAFFALPQSTRDDFLSPTCTSTGTALSMTRFFLSAPSSLRRQLAAPLFRKRPPEVECPAP